LIRKLELFGAKNLLEVGGGWGGLAVAIAKAAPHVHITSLTVSHEQFLVAKRRAEEAGVADRVTFLEQDYRKYEPEEKFDRIVSVEMIEAVDWRDLDTYFDKLAEFIDPERGIIALQAITVPHHKEPSQHHRASFANVAIFPGGYLSSVRKIRQHMERRGFGLAEKPTEMGPSYALTLHEWLKNLAAHRPTLSEKWQAEGHSVEEIDRFYRGFGFYLAACVAGFRPETGPNMGGQQLVFKPAA
ncbi:class I SAM-dependent methyltransferase, partial [Candidatus Saccharibacteria bacterium]|nr:class I SAM-dependent methyltransferase [Candidatus Saccharibacteria bacterium]